MLFFDADDIIGCVINQPIRRGSMLVIQNIIRQREMDIKILKESLIVASVDDQRKISGLIAGLELGIDDLKITLALLPIYLDVDSFTVSD